MTRCACAATFASCVAMTKCRLFFDTQTFKQFNNFTAGVRIKIAGRLVGQQQFRFVDKRAGDGDALLFAAGKFGRLVLRPLLKANARKQFASAFFGIARGNSGDARGQADIFQRVKFRQQMIRLKNKTDAAVAEMRQFAFGKSREVSGRRKKISPAFGKSSPPIKWSSVLLPAPDAPRKREKIAARNLQDPRRAKLPACVCPSRKFL